LICELLRFGHEILNTDEVDLLSGIAGKNAKYSQRELKMAEDLIDGMAADWEPRKYKDTYYDDIMKRVKQKIKSGKSHVIEDPDVEIEKVEPTKVIDLLPLLKKSLAEKGKGGAKKKSSGKSKRKVKGRNHETAHRVHA
jgi:DNA end-binding protein Ku